MPLQPSLNLPRPPWAASAPRAMFPMLALLLATSSARADEAAIRRQVGEFLMTEDPVARAGLAESIAADPAYDRTKVSQWLHAAATFPERPAGSHTLTIDLRGGDQRQVALRIPMNYNPRRPWPLLYVLHGMGGSSAGILSYFERVLGPRVDEFVLAAPQHYQEHVVHDAWPPTGEHAALLDRLRREMHIDSDRVYVAGYSKGGHTTWTLAVLYADRFAAALPIAGTFLLPEVDQLWDVFLPNVRHLPVLGVWGAGDTLAGTRGEESPEGGIAGLNRRLKQLAGDLKLPIVMIEDPDKGHGGVIPPAEALADLLQRRRVHYPTDVEHTFRHIDQAQAYWIEGHEWRGDQWTDKLPPVRLRPDEDPNKPEDLRAALVRTFRASLGELTGKVEGQLIDVRRRKVTELTIWIGDGMIDWDQPVTIKVSGRQLFQEKLEPNLLLCLSEAARTYDFDRLRWAGFHFRSGSRLRPLTGDVERDGGRGAGRAAPPARR